MSLSKARCCYSARSVPVVMAGALVLGTVSAAAHHVFSIKVNGRVVQSSEQQQWYSVIGTGLAFMTKTLLGATAGLAYTQLLWYGLRAKTFTLAGVDATFAVVRDPLSFLNLDLWSNGFHLAVMAAIIWALPLMAIFTPGTLTVQPDTQYNKTIVQRPIPIMDYSSVRSFGQVRGSHALYAGSPSIEISRLVSTVTARGATMDSPAPYTNCTYHLEFYGPSLSCGPAVSTNTTRIAEFVKAEAGEYEVPFLAFVPMNVTYPDGPDELNYNGPDVVMNGLNFTAQEPGSRGFADQFDAESVDHARIYVVVNDGLSGLDSANKTIECGLFNMSYSVDFAFNNAQPEITMLSTTRLNGITYCDSVSHGDSWVCRREATSYFAILHAFGLQLLGFLLISTGVVASFRTQVTKSVLMDSTELYGIQYYMSTGEQMSSDAMPPGAIGLTQMLEEAFKNVTLSLFSNTFFLQDEEDAVMTPVTVLTPQNIYTYAPRNLLICYIIGVTATTICAAVGFLCISKASSAAYSTSFSTILRTTRNPELDKIVSPSETSGAEPLTKGLANTRLRLVRGTKPSGHEPSDAVGDADVGTNGGAGWTYFHVAEDQQDYELATASKVRRNHSKPVSDGQESDVNSLLRSDEVERN